MDTDIQHAPPTPLAFRWGMLLGLAVFVVDIVGLPRIARFDHDPPLPRHDILVAHPERLPDPHPRARQQREQKTVAQPLLAVDHRRDLLQRQRPRQPLDLRQPARAPARLQRGDPRQERLVAAIAAAGRGYGSSAASRFPLRPWNS